MPFLSKNLWFHKKLDIGLMFYSPLPSITSIIVAVHSLVCLHCWLMKSLRTALYLLVFALVLILSSFNKVSDTQ